MKFECCKKMKTIGKKCIMRTWTVALLLLISNTKGLVDSTWYTDHKCARDQMYHICKLKIEQNPDLKHYNNNMIFFMHYT